MGIKIKMKPPVMPNNVFIDPVKCNINVGFRPVFGKIVVKDLTEKQANEFADLMRNTFMKHWKKQK